jgi:steroid delta-isomerase-like uncharacterized protein
MADNGAILRRLYEAWNERNFDEVAGAMAPDGQIMIVGTGDTFTGPDGARTYNASWANGFPDGRITVDHLYTDGDTVIAEFTGRGTHTGTMVTSAAEIPATGRSVTIKLCDVVEFRDGMIVSQRSYFDSGSMMAQLGLTADRRATATQ